MSELRMPVEILAFTHGKATLRPQSAVVSCAQCAAGKGCGQSQWFRGFIKDKPFTIATTRQLHSSFAELVIPEYSFSLICLLTYAVPLLAFFLGLFAGIALPAWGQFAVALVIAGISVRIGKNIALRILLNQLDLQEIPQKSPEKA